MCWVCMSVEVDLNGCVDGDKAKATDHLCIVGNLWLTNDKFVLEEVNIVIYALKFVICDCERTSGSALHTFLEHEVYDSVLKHLCVNLHGRHVRVASKSKEYGVGCSAHTALEREEARRYDASFLLVHEEVGHILANLVCHRVSVLEWACLIRNVALHNTYNLLRIDLKVSGANAVCHFLYHYRLAHWWVQWLIHIVNAYRFGWVESIELNDDALLCHASHSGSYASGSCEIYLAVILNGTRLNDSPVNLSEETIAEVLCHHAKMYVIVSNLASIDMLAEGCVGSIWSAVADSLLIREDAIARLACGSACEDANLVRVSCFMLCMSHFSDFGSDCLWSACWCESRQADVVSILNQCCSFSCCDSCECHIVVFWIFFKVYFNNSVLMDFIKLQEPQNILNDTKLP